MYNNFNITKYRHNSETVVLDQMSTLTLGGGAHGLHSPQQFASPHTLTQWIDRRFGLWGTCMRYVVNERWEIRVAPKYFQSTPFPLAVLCHLKAHASELNPGNTSFYLPLQMCPGNSA